MSKTNTTQDIAIDWVQRAVSTINKQLAVEIERCGFSMDEIRKGKKQKLVRNVKVSETDSRYIMESFSVTGKNIPERIILAVKWTPKGYEMERNSDAVANGIKANPKFGIKKGQSPVFVGQVTQHEIDVEALANKYMKDYEDNAKKESGIIKIN